MISDFLSQYIQTIQKVYFYTLLFLVVAGSMFYAYFVNQTVLDVVERKQLETEISERGAAIAQMEFTYMSKKNEITKDYARSLGYHEAQDKKYVRRTNTTLTLR